MCNSKMTMNHVELAILTLETGSLLFDLSFFKDEPFERLLNVYLHLLYF